MSKLPTSIALAASVFGALVATSPAADKRSAIDDHLTTMTAGRMELSDGLAVETLVSVSTFELDLDGDGKNELFVGHKRMWTGDTKGVYVSIYAEEDGGYSRVSPTTDDIRMAFDREGGWFYCGKIDGMPAEGLLQVSVPSSLDPPRFDRAIFIYLDDGEVGVEELSPLDASTEEGKRLFRFHAESPQIPSREPSAHQHLTNAELRQAGYDLSSWASPTADQAKSVANGSSKADPTRDIGRSDGQAAKSPQKVAGSRFPLWMFLAGAVVLLTLVLVFRKTMI